MSNKKTKKKFSGKKVVGTEVIGTIKVTPKMYFNTHQGKTGAWEDKTENGGRNNKANQKAKNSLKKYIG